MGALKVKVGGTWTDIPIGPQGPPGADGVGVPAGGAAGQVLTKDTATNFDTSWQTPTGGGGGSLAWADITGKPSTFPPDEHDSAHDDRFSLLAHTHTAPAWTDISGKPTTFAPTEHDADHTDAFATVGHTHAAHSDADHDDRFSLLAHLHAGVYAPVEHDAAHDDRFEQLGHTHTATPQVLDWLTDVATAGADTNEVLTYNGTTWVPQAPATGGAVAWADITGKPTTFAPTDHDADHDDRFALLAHLHTPGIAPTINLSPPVAALSVITTVDDGSAASGWADKFVFRYHHAGGSPIPVAWFNEYGEFRGAPAKVNTVPLRLFTKNAPVTQRTPST